MIVKVTDLAGTDGSVEVDHREVAEAIKPWYPEAPLEVVEMIDKLQEMLDQRANTTPWESYLAITIRPVTR